MRLLRGADKQVLRSSYLRKNYLRKKDGLKKSDGIYADARAKGLIRSGGWGGDVGPTGFPCFALPNKGAKDLFSATWVIDEKFSQERPYLRRSLGSYLRQMKESLQSEVEVDTSFSSFFAKIHYFL